MRNLLLLVFIYFPLSVLSQDFEGIIEYEQSYSNNKTNLSIKELHEMFGTHVTSYLKNGYYKEITDSEYMSYQLYRYKDNMIYYKDNFNSDTLFYKATNLKHDIPLNHKLEKNADTILGYACDKLIITDDYGTREYFFSDKLTLNPDYYKNYSYINKDKIVALMKAYYLRLRMTYSSFTVDIIAKNIKHKKLSRRIFELPKKRINVESPN